MSTISSGTVLITDLLYSYHSTIILSVLYNTDLLKHLMVWTSFVTCSVNLTRFKVKLDKQSSTCCDYVVL